MNKEGVRGYWLEGGDVDVVVFLKRVVEKIIIIMGVFSLYIRECGYDVLGSDF